MQVKELTILDIDVSEFNVRKNITDGQQDSTIEDLAQSIAKQGLLSPITVFQKPDGRYGLVAGQRRLMACKHLGMSSISAIVRDSMSASDATAISLVENVHRADMNPTDKARAYNTLLQKFGDLASVSRETGVGKATISKYIQLLDLSPELQNKLAAGEAKNTEALARLARTFENPDQQVDVWDQISGFTQDVQQEILKRSDGDLDKVNRLVELAIEGEFDARLVRNCPYDCPNIPDELKPEVLRLLNDARDEVIREIGTRRKGILDH